MGYTETHGSLSISDFYWDIDMNGKIIFMLSQHLYRLKTEFHFLNPNLFIDEFTVIYPIFHGGDLFLSFQVHQMACSILTVRLRIIT